MEGCFLRSSDRKASYLKPILRSAPYRFETRPRWALGVVDRWRVDHGCTCHSYSLRSLTMTAASSTARAATTLLLPRCVVPWLDSVADSCQDSRAGVVRRAGVAALSAPRLRLGLVVPDTASVDTLRRAGYALNDQVAARWQDRAAHGDLAKALGRVEISARRVRAQRARIEAPKVPVRVPSGGWDTPMESTRRKGEPWRGTIVKVTLPVDERAAFGEAARECGMSLGAWLRDGLAAWSGDDVRRVASAELFTARRVIRACAALVTQAEVLAYSDHDRCVAGDAAEALGAALDRLAWGAA